MSVYSLTGQCMQVPIGLDSIVNIADLIIEGEVLSSQPFKPVHSKNIFTKHTVLVHTVLKGQVSTSSVSIVTRGGRLGNREEVVTPEVRLSSGDLGMFLLRDQSKQHNPLIPDLRHSYDCFATDQSYYRYDAGSKRAYGAFQDYDLRTEELSFLIATATKESIRPLSGWSLPQWLADHKVTPSKTITSFAPSSIVAGVNNVITINGSGFGSAVGNVQFVFANDPGFRFNIDPSYIISWTNTQVTTIVPYPAATGPVWIETTGGTLYQSSNTLTIPYAITSYNDPNLQADDIIRFVSRTTTGNIEYQLNTAFAANTAAAASFTRAISSWKCGIDVHWTQGSNTTIDNAAHDEQSVITFSSSLNPGVLGVASTYYYWCSAPPTQRYCDEFDIRFRTPGAGVTWEFGPDSPTSSETDFESVALHELGHTLQLGHVNDTDEVMHFQITNGEEQREVDGQALAGGLFMMDFHQGGGIVCSNSFALTNNPPATVTNTNTTGTGSLSAAIANACPSSAIDFSAGLTGSTIFTGGTPFTIDKNISITGLGMSNLTLSGNNTSRIFDISSGANLELSNIRLLNGSSSINGGAFYNQGAVTLNNVILEGNKQGSTDKAFTNSPEGDVIIEGDTDIKE